MAEILSPLARLVRAGVLEPNGEREAPVEAGALHEEFIEPSEDHLVRALAMQDQVRVLDVACAQDRGAALMRTDQPLTCGHLPVEVLAPDTA